MSHIIEGRAENPTLSTARCLIKDCNGKSRWKPILMVSPIGWKFMKVNELKIPHSGFLCQEHRDIPMREILNDEELNQIKAHLQSLKLGHFDWSTLEMGVAPVKDT